MASHQQKEQLRKQFLSRREGLSLQEWAASSKIIIGKLKKLADFQAARTVHCYVSMNERREVNTHSLIKEMIEGGQKVVVPRTQFAGRTLCHVELGSFGSLVANKWGVLEPANGKKAEIAEIDLVIVPMAGGDEKGNRIGYGGGFYDRFLKDVLCPKVGLCFEQNIIKKLPVESFDIPMDKIVTEERVLG